MADSRKETERAELHRTIWGIANDLRGSVDGWDFKQIEGSALGTDSEDDFKGLFDDIDFAAFVFNSIDVGEFTFLVSTST
jgi:type I restriction-modification system DNA methylase subunit